MKKCFPAIILVTLMVLIGLSAHAGNYDYIDQSILNGEGELSWITLVTANDAPAWDGMTMDMLFLEQTGEKYAVPEDPAQRADWMSDICKNRTGGKGDFAIAKTSGEDFLRVAYDLDEWTFYDYKFHRYSDYMRIRIDGLTAYVYWTTGTDRIQRGAKAVYDDETGTFTVTEFNLLTLDGSPSDAIAAAYFGYLRNTCNYVVDTQSGNLLFREEPSGSAEIIAKIPKGGEVNAIFDYVCQGDNGYDYMPARYDMNDRSYYGWIAMEYLGMNERVDAMAWVGCKAEDLEYPSLSGNTQSVIPTVTPVPAAEPTAVPETPVPTAEPAEAPATQAPATVLPAAPASLTAGPEEYAGIWYSTWVSADTMEGDPRTQFGFTIILTLNEDGTGEMDYLGSDGGGRWGMDDRGIVRYRGDGTPLSLLEDGSLCWGTAISGYILFSQDPEAEAHVFPEVPTAQTAAPQVTAETGSVTTADGDFVGVKYVGKTYIAGGVSMDASMLGGEYAILLSADGTAAFTMAGTEVPGYSWKQVKDHIDVDAFGTVLITLTMQEDGTMLMDYSGAFKLVMEPQK